MKKLIRALTAVMLCQAGVYAQDFEWAETFGSGQRDKGLTIATDPDGNVVNTGYYRNSATFGTTTLTSDSTNMYIQKLDELGNVLWAQQLPPTQTQNENQGLTVDALGDIIVSGRFQGTFDFDPDHVGGSLTATNASGTSPYNVFILKLDSNGNFEWVRSIEADGAGDVEVDPSGNIYVQGTFDGTVDFDPSPGSTSNLTNSTLDASPFIVKLDNSGDFIWAVDTEGMGHQITYDIAVNSDGHVFSTGIFRGTVDFDPASGSSSNLSGIATAFTEYHDSFLQELDENGNFVMVKHIPGTVSGTTVTSTSCASTVAIDALDNIYMAGTFDGGVDFDHTDAPGTFTLNGGTVKSTFIQRYDATGDMIWTKQVVTSEPNLVSVTRMAMLDNTICITGLFQNTVNFNPDGAGTPENLTASGTSTINSYTLVLTLDGDFSGVNRCTFDTVTEDVDASEEGDLYLAGFFNGAPDFDPEGAGFTRLSNGQEDIYILKYGVTAPVLPPDVQAVHPDTTICCTDGVFNLGSEWIPTGNVYNTFGNFTPEHGFPDGIGASQGGAFIDLPPCVNAQTFPAPNDDFLLYSLDPCECGAGVYPIIYAFTDTITGLTGRDTMFVTVEDPTDVVFDALPINLCTYDGPVALTPTIGEGLSCEITGPGVLPGNLFDADAAGVGTHTIEITCTTPSGCTATTLGTIIVEDERYWHNTTSDANIPANSNAGDEGLDIYTDADGYVYATGYYYDGTTFEDHTGTSISLPGTLKGERFYTVCYDECGAIQWVIYDRDISFNRTSAGFGVSRGGDDIFVAINYIKSIDLVTVFPDGSLALPTLSTSGTSLYGNVAVISINGPDSPDFGELISITNRLGGYRGTALYSSENAPTDTKNLYICGSTDFNADGIPSVAYANMDYISSTNTFNLEWSISSVSQSAIHTANDIVADIEGNTILITGTFDDTLSLTNGAGFESVSTTADQDAFFAMLDIDGDVAFGQGLRKFGVQSGEFAEGTCLTGDRDHFYVGGNYEGVSEAPFNYELENGDSDANSVFINSFIFSYEFRSGAAYLEHIWSVDSGSDLTGMDNEGTDLVFLGNIGKGNPTTSSGSVGYNPNGGDRILFTGRIDRSTPNWYLPVLNNTTENLGLGTHFSTRATIGIDGYAYYTGQYFGNVSYLFGTPLNGDLLSSGTGTGVRNAYFLRQELRFNELRNPQTGGQDIGESAAEDAFNVTVYPNPTSGLVNVTLNDYETDSPVDVTVYNSVGKRVYSGQLTQKTFEIDLSNVEKGIYILKANFEETTQVIRIVKS